MDQVKIDIRNNTILQRIFNKDLISIEELVNELENLQLEKEEKEEEERGN